jgi:hypothetical protein
VIINMINKCTLSGINKIIMTIMGNRSNLQSS